jgi:hypothetical protein
VDLDAYRICGGSGVAKPNRNVGIYAGLNKLFLNAILLGPSMMDFRLRL